MAATTVVAARRLAALRRRRSHIIFPSTAGRRRIQRESHASQLAAQAQQQARRRTNRRCRIRLLWLEGSVEIFLEPRKQSWTIELGADRVLQLSRRLTLSPARSEKVPSLQYCGVHERQPLVREAQWLPTGPLACDEMIFDLGGDHAAGEESLRFAAKGATGSEDAG